MKWTDITDIMFCSIRQIYLAIIVINDGEKEREDDTAMSREEKYHFQFY